MAIIFLLFATLCGFIINGYYFNYIDSNIYLVYLKKLDNSLLYNGDYLFSQSQTSYTVINNIFVFLKGLLNVNYDWLYILFFLFTALLLYLAIFYITRSLTENPLAPYLAVLFFIIPKWVASVGNFTHARFFIARDLSFAFSLISLLLIMKKHFIFSIALSLIALIVNPSMLPPIIILQIFNIYTQAKFKYKNYIFISLLALFGTTFVIYFMRNIAGNPLDSKWLEIMRQRGPYSFPDLWKYTGWGNLFLYIILGMPPFLFAKIKNRKVISWFVYISTGLFLFHIIISYIYPIAFLIQFQLLRSLTFIATFSLILTAVSISELLYSRKIALILLAYFCSAVIFLWGDHLTYLHIGFLSLFSIFSIYYLTTNRIKKYTFPSIHLIFVFSLLLIYTGYSFIIKKPDVFLPYYFATPTYYTTFDKNTYWDWISTQLWAKNNTSKETIFLTPPSLEGFRIFSERSTIEESKDGSVIFYSPVYAKEWKKRNDILNEKYTCNVENIKFLKRIYNFNYVVFKRKDCKLNLQSVYVNKTFEILEVF